MSFWQDYAAFQQANVANQQLAFSQQQYGDYLKRLEKTDALNERVTNNQLNAQNTLMGWAGEDRARYKSTFQPVEDKFVDKAMNWASADKQAQAAAEAKADVTNAFADQQAQQQRQLAAQGVNPNSGRWAGTTRATDTAEALASAGAQNNARSTLRNQEMGYLGQAANLGRGLSTQANTETTSGVSAGTNAASVGAQGNSDYLSGVKVANQGFSGATSALNGLSSTAYQTNAQALQQQQMNNSSLGGLFSGIGSLAGLFLSDEDAKENKREEDGNLDALQKMPVERWTYKPGRGDGGEHVGTYAQDFQRATGLGDGKSISPIDAIGVTMGAVKELSTKVDKLAARRNKPRERSTIRRAA